MRMTNAPATAVVATTAAIIHMSPMTQQHSTTKANTITYGKSWADDIQKYHVRARLCLFVHATTSLLATVRCT